METKPQQTSITEAFQQVARTRDKPIIEWVPGGFVVRCKKRDLPLVFRAMRGEVSK